MIDIFSPESTLLPGSTLPLFSSFFEGADFFDSPETGGGVFALGEEGQTNIFIFGDVAGGNDVAGGGDEVDIIMANAGDDNIIGAEGTDFLFGGIGDDIVRGGAGDDVVVGNEGSDLAIGGEGSDIFEFFADQFLEGDLDIIRDFEEGSDALVVVGSTDVSYDSLSGFLSVDGAVVASLDSDLDLEVLTRANSSVLFSSEADVSGFSSSQTVSSPETDEDSPEEDSPESAAGSLQAGSTPPLFASFFEGAEFFDSPEAGGGVYVAGEEDQTNIILFGDVAGGNDVAVGGDGLDVIMGEGGDDNLQGAKGTDFVFGGLGDDIVRGGLGDDVVVGNEGSDLLISGGGSDVYEFFADQFLEGDLDILLDFEAGEDQVVVVGSTDVSYDALSGFLNVDGTDVAVLQAGLDLDAFSRAGSTVVA
ncbi:MAG: hypothetical protein ACFB5Z_19665 [Elainellaceae cyanobacterium]